MEQFCAASVPRPPPTDGAAATGLHEPPDSSGKPSAARLARPPFHNRMCFLVCPPTGPSSQPSVAQKANLKRCNGCEYEGYHDSPTQQLLCPPSFRLADASGSAPTSPRLPPRRRRADCSRLQDPSPCTSTVRATNATIETSVPRHPFPGPC